jgi:hypothetical protein
MATHILNLDDCPSDPVEAIIWLDGVWEAVSHELDAAYEEAYFEARVRGQFETALSVGRAPRKRALAWTRRRNNRMGRQVRWSDGLDPSSSAYVG